MYNKNFYFPPDGPFNDQRGWRHFGFKFTIGLKPDQ